LDSTDARKMVNMRRSNSVTDGVIFASDLNCNLSMAGVFFHLTSSGVDEFMKNKQPRMVESQQ
jgi:hypothetical protein